MNATQRDDRRAIDLPLDAALAIVGPARSGKTAALVERSRRAEPATARILPDFIELAREVHELLGVAAPAPVISAALFTRFGSRGEADYADRLLSALRFGFGGHLEKPNSDKG